MGNRLLEEASLRVSESIRIEDLGLGGVGILQSRLATVTAERDELLLERDDYKDASLVAKRTYEAALAESVRLREALEKIQRMAPLDHIELRVIAFNALNTTALADLDKGDNNV
jgi:hypothetical protein